MDRDREAFERGSLFEDRPARATSRLSRVFMPYLLDRPPTAVRATGMPVGLAGNTQKRGDPPAPQPARPLARAAQPRPRLRALPLERRRSRGIANQRT